LAARYRRLVLVSDFLDPAFKPAASPFSRNAYILLYRPIHDLFSGGVEKRIRRAPVPLAEDLPLAYDGAIGTSLPAPWLTVPPAGQALETKGGVLLAHDVSGPVPVLAVPVLPPGGEYSLQPRTGNLRLAGHACLGLDRCSCLALGAQDPGLEKLRPVP
jgi:hypothetical protein